MKTGDLLAYNPKSSPQKVDLLCLCMSVDLQNGLMTVRQITDATCQILDDSYPMVSWSANIYDLDFQIISSNGTICHNIMQGRAYPTWVLNAVQNAAQPQGATQTSKPTYPIGSLFIGTGKAGNVWIINKQNSDEISLLWDGNGSRFCGSELERADRLKPNFSRKPDSASDVVDFINNNFKQKFSISQIPTWALTLMYTQSNPLPTPKAVPTGMGPAVTDAMLKNGILKTKPKIAAEKELKKLDSLRQSCNHEFRSYVGFTDIYDYCIHCDTKIRGK